MRLDIIDSATKRELKGLLQSLIGLGLVIGLIYAVYHYNAGNASKKNLRAAMKECPAIVDDIQQADEVISKRQLRSWLATCKAHMLLQQQKNAVAAVPARS